MTKKIYTMEALMTAVHDFNELCTITMDEDRDRFILTFTNCVTDPERTMKEFENYTIDLMVSENVRS